MTSDTLVAKGLAKLSGDWLSIELDSSLYYSNEALKLAEQLNTSEIIAQSYLLKGLAYACQKRYEQAEQVGVTGLTFTSDSSYAKIYLSNLLGIIYTEKKDYEKALKYQQNCIDLTKQLNLVKGSWSPAYYIQRLYADVTGGGRVFEVRNAGGVEDIIPNCLLEIGRVYEQQGEVMQAIEFFNQALAVEKEKGNTTNTARILNDLSAAFQKTMQPHSSIENAQKALELARTNKDYRNVVYACYNLAQCYNLLKKYEQSLGFYQLSKSFQDSLINVERARLVMSLQAKHEIEQLDAENQFLAEKKALLDKEMSQKHWLIGILCFTLLFCGMIALLLQKLNRSKNKSNAILNQRNKEIIAQNQIVEKQSHELKATLEQLKSTQSQLIHAGRMAALGQLTAGVAHEINNPINFISVGISGLKQYIELLLEVNEKFTALKSREDFIENIAKINAFKENVQYSEVADDIGDLMNSITEGVERTTLIVENLQRFSHPSRASKSDVDVHMCLDNTLNLVKSTLGQNTTIKKSYDVELPLIEANQGQLNQVFLNIITNAAQAIGTSRKGKIEIITQTATNQIKIVITDNGDGMHSNIQQKIFEPFFTTKEEGKGMGLGLSISYGIIKDHGGTIEVTSTPSKGTSFIINLPRT